MPRQRRHLTRSADPGRSCLTKQRHASKQEGLDHLAHIQRANARRACEMHLYRCAYCGGWHVGHPIGSMTSSREKTWLTRPRRWERVIAEE